MSTVLFNKEALTRKMASTESMTDDELFAKDVPELLSLIEDFKMQLSKVTPCIDNLESCIKGMDSSNGIDFLQAKCHVFLDYIVNLVLIILLKVDGRSIDDHIAIERLVETRTILEKMRPIELKLNYQIDKLVKLAKTGGQASGLKGNDPLGFKPNPENMTSKLEEGGESSDEEAAAKGIYVPPRVSAMPYEEDTAESQKKKFEEKTKMKLLNKSLLKELREEYSENPEEIRDNYRSLRRGKNEEKDMERERYEEDNLIRLSHTKKDKAPNNDSSLRDLAKFDNFGFGDESDDGNQPKVKRTKKSKFSAIGKKKKGKFVGKKRKFKK